MKFLFLTPRLHNNYHGILEVILRNGNSVEAGVLYALPTERHDIIKPQILGYSKLFNSYCRLFDKSSNTHTKIYF